MKESVAIAIFATIGVIFIAAQVTAMLAGY